MVLDMRAQGIKYFPMGGLKSKDELKAVAEACARHGVPMMEPSGGVDLSNFKEITKNMSRCRSRKSNATYLWSCNR